MKKGLIELIEDYRKNPSADNFDTLMSYPNTNVLSADEEEAYNNFVDSCL